MSYIETTMSDYETSFNVKTTKGLNLQVQLSKKESLCILTAFANENNIPVQVGFASFFLPGDSGWLNFIEVNPKYRNKGIGYELLALTEQICGVYGSAIIRGKYLPEADETAFFYKKLGYFIYYDEEAVCDMLVGGGLDHLPHFPTKTYMYNLIAEKENSANTSTSNSTNSSTGFDSETLSKQ